MLPLGHARNIREFPDSARIAPASLAWREICDRSNLSHCVQWNMPIPTPASLPKAGWAVLLYAPPAARPHLARALDLFVLGSAAWNLRQAFDEALRDLGPQAEAWIAARGRAAAEECAWFRATVYGSTPRRPGLSRRSRSPWPRNQTRAMPPLAAKTVVRSFLEQLILLRFKESGS